MWHAIVIEDEPLIVLHIAGLAEEAGRKRSSSQARLFRKFDGFGKRDRQQNLATFLFDIDAVLKVQASLAD